MITDEDFTQAMREAVAERGEDYVYPKDDPDYHIGEGWGSTCVYQTSDGTPACIIGLAMSKLGLTLPSHYANVEAHRALDGIGLSNRALTAATVAQETQDCGDTWGAAFENYLSYLGERQYG